MTLIRSGVATATGRVRAINQDRVVVSPYLFAVADGMGGHLGGEVAAEVATETLSESFTEGRSVEFLTSAVMNANRMVWERSHEDPRLRGMGTTLTAVALVSNGEHEWLELVNVGDSRAYLWRQGQLSQLTDDHSLVEEMVRSGELSPDDALTHPSRHILTRALGIEEEVSADIWPLEALVGDRLLICSDGLFNEIGDSGIAQILSEESDPQAAAERLVQAADDHGGYDNITALVLDVSEAPSGAPQELIDASADGAVKGRSRPLLPTEEEEGDKQGKKASPIGGDTIQPAVAGAYSWRRRRRKAQRTEVRATLPAARRVTPLSLLFCVVVLVVLGGAVGAVYWYAGKSWFVTVSGSRIVIYQGRPGGVLWIDPKLAARTGVTTTEVLASRLPQLRAGVEETSLAAAFQYVDNLRREYQQLPLHPTSTTTTIPSSIPSTAPPTVPTTVTTPRTTLVSPTTTATAPPTTSVSRTTSTGKGTPTTVPSSVPVSATQTTAPRATSTTRGKPSGPAVTTSQGKA